MEHAVLTAHSSPLHHPPGYFDGFVQGTLPMHDPNVGIPMLNSLLSQKTYLNDLLSKTATTLNALRERQTRNERALSLNPKPRSRRKKIQQNRWRTNKTITTCENEERVILNCLHVCNSNIATLESLLNPSDLSSTAVECTPSQSDTVSSEMANFDWDGWTDEAPISPFAREHIYSSPLDEVPPETPLEKVGFDGTCGRRPSPLLLRSHPISGAGASLAPPNADNSRFANSSLSADAAAFEPAVPHVPQAEDEMASQFDKLSISGLLASKRMKLLQRKRFSETAIGHMFRTLVSEEHAVPARSRRSWAASTPQRQKLAEQLGREWAKSTTSV